MPNLTQYLANPDLYPTRTGEPTGTVPIPVEPSPTLNPAVGQQFGAGLVGVGQSLEGLASSLNQRQELAMRQAKARNTLLAQDALNTYTVDLDTFGAQDQQNPDYTNHAQRVLDYGRQRISELAQPMSPGARELFHVHAGQRLAEVNRQALTFAQQTMLAQVPRIADQTDQAYINGALGATDDADLAQKTVQYMRSIQGLVDAGLMYQPEATQRMQKAQEAVETKGMLLKIDTDPAGSLLHLVGLAQGQPGQPGYPVPPESHLAPLIEHAQQQLRSQVTLTEAQQAAQHRVLQDSQGRRASEYRMQIYKVGATIPELVGLLDPINTDRQTQALGEADHKELLQDVEHVMEKIRNDATKDVDVPAIAKEARLRIDMAETPEQLDRARDWIRSNAESLSSGRFQELLTKVETKRQGDDPLNDDQVKEGRRIILAGAFPGGIVPAVLDKIDAGIKSRLSDAVDAYFQSMRDVHDKEGVTAMRSKAIPTARTLRDAYFRDEGDARRAALPPGIKDAKTYEAALRGLAAMPELPYAVKRQIYQRIKEAGLPHETPAPAAGKTP